VTPRREGQTPLYHTFAEEENGLTEEERREEPRGRVDAREERYVIRKRRPRPVPDQESTDPAIVRMWRCQSQSNDYRRDNPQHESSRPQDLVIRAEQLEELLSRERQLHFDRTPSVREQAKCQRRADRIRLQVVEFRANAAAGRRKFGARLKISPLEVSDRPRIDGT
jgi:hypothetical protein